MPNLSVSQQVDCALLDFEPDGDACAEYVREGGAGDLAAGGELKGAGVDDGRGMRRFLREQDEEVVIRLPNQDIGGKRREARVRQNVPGGIRVEYGYGWSDSVLSARVTNDVIPEHSRARGHGDESIRLARREMAKEMNALPEGRQAWHVSPAARPDVKLWKKKTLPFETEGEGQKYLSREGRIA